MNFYNKSLTYKPILNVLKYYNKTANNLYKNLLKIVCVFSKYSVYLTKRYNLIGVTSAHFICQGGGVMLTYNFKKSSMRWTT